MANHGSANVRVHTPHANETTRTATVINVLKRRAQAVLHDQSIDPQDRVIIRYALEVNDPWLAELVRRAEANQPIAGAVNFEETPETNIDGFQTATG